MKEIFNSYIENAFGERKQAEFKFEQFEYNYKKYFPVNKEDKVLDIGIGRGEMLSCFKRWGYKNYFGIDISSSTVEFCKSLGLKCKYVEDSTKYLENNKNTFQLITVIDVLEHIPREEAIPFLKAVRDALKNGGICIIQVPNLQAPDAQLHMYNDVTHVMGYTEHSLQQLLISVGFSKFHFQGFEDIINKNWKALARKILRSVYWKIVRFTRKINGNLNPRILNPVFSVIIRK